MGEMIELNGREYGLPSRPVVVICADGCDPAYIEVGLAAGVLPTVSKWREHGFYAIADAAMPTFTNPNNMSIVTGVPPAMHGISGNFALDRASGAELMMTDRPRDAAQRHDPRLDVATGRAGRGDHRQGQIAPDARPRSSDRR
jgi:phosphonoacetate hydrolase